MGFNLSIALSFWIKLAFFFSETRFILCLFVCFSVFCLQFQALQIFVWINETFRSLLYSNTLKKTNYDLQSFRKCEI